MAFACASSAPEASRAQATTAATASQPATAAAPPPEPARLFDEMVSPVLRRKCTPCHFPGGEMYQRMPFDREATIKDHADGVLRRLGGEDHEVLERWLAKVGPQAGLRAGGPGQPSTLR